MKVKLSSGHNVVIASLSKLNFKSKTSFTKVVQFGMLFDNVAYKVKVELSFGHKAVVSSLFKLNIVVSKNLFYKSWSVWYAT